MVDGHLFDEVWYDEMPVDPYPGGDYGNEQCSCPKHEGGCEYGVKEPTDVCAMCWMQACHYEED